MLSFLRFTDQWGRVRDMMRGFGQPTPDTPTMPADGRLQARSLLTVEEGLEWADACGVDVYVDNPNGGPPINLHGKKLRYVKTRPANFKLMMDAAGDIAVVNTGNFVECGVADVPILETIDANNLLKVANGKLNPDTGKFEKAPDHQPPDLKFPLLMQGCDKALLVDEPRFPRT